MAKVETVRINPEVQMSDRVMKVTTAAVNLADSHGISTQVYNFNGQTEKTLEKSTKVKLNNSMRGLISEANKGNNAYGGALMVFSRNGLIVGRGMVTNKPKPETRRSRWNNDYFELKEVMMTISSTDVDMFDTNQEISSKAYDLKLNVVNFYGNTRNRWNPTPKAVRAKRLGENYDAQNNNNRSISVETYSYCNKKDISVFSMAHTNKMFEYMKTTSESRKNIRAKNASGNTQILTVLALGNVHTALSNFYGEDGYTLTETTFGFDKNEINVEKVFTFKSLVNVDGQLKAEIDFRGNYNIETKSWSGFKTHITPKRELNEEVAISLNSLRKIIRVTKSSALVNLHNNSIGFHSIVMGQDEAGINIKEYDCLDNVKIKFKQTSGTYSSIHTSYQGNLNVSGKEVNIRGNNINSIPPVITKTEGANNINSIITAIEENFEISAPFIK
jgi:hypothetical protein